MKAKIILFSLVIFFFLQMNTHAKQEMTSEPIFLQKLDNINYGIEEIKDKQNAILESQNDDSINPIKEIGLPVILSIIAGFIFWVIFQVRPAHKRKKQLRPKIEKDLSSISSTMIHMVQLSLLHCENPVSYFGIEISKGQLTKELIEIGLYNKALNRFHLVGPFSNNIIIGESIYNHTQKIEERIERIFYFNDQLSVKEINILDEIYQLIKKYSFEDFNKQYYIKIGNKDFSPIDPTLSYLSEFFFDIYVLRERLDRVLSSSISNDINFLYKKISILHREQKFKKAIRLIKKNLKKYSQSDNLLKWYLFSIEYECNKTDALITLEKIIDINTSLVSHRGFLKDLIKDENILRILEKKSSNEKIQQLFSAIQQEDEGKAYLISLNTALKAHIDNKIKT
ncbi:hypothetical protein [Acinetobacter courvalinii]|uniref:hypothetical protein n=1 Tax=Acinetobacter courvalinii TaxID=280147 RepID=UPI0018FF7BFB|nr:hypothetical protein [Acinetobacter courvalinii]MBJ9955945.1 hypothetical protein [Acinetobacter courvalinii]